MFKCATTKLCCILISMFEVITIINLLTYLVSLLLFAYTFMFLYLRNIDPALFANILIWFSNYYLPTAPKNEPFSLKFIKTASHRNYYWVFSYHMMALLAKSLPDEGEMSVEPPMPQNVHPQQCFSAVIGITFVRLRCSVDMMVQSVPQPFIAHSHSMNHRMAECFTLIAIYKTPRITRPLPIATSKVQDTLKRIFIHIYSKQKAAMGLLVGGWWNEVSIIGNIRDGENWLRLVYRYHISTPEAGSLHQHAAYPTFILVKKSRRNLVSYTDHIHIPITYTITAMILMKTL